MTNSTTLGNILLVPTSFSFHLLGGLRRPDLPPCRLKLLLVLLGAQISQKVSFFLHVLGLFLVEDA